jgi:hypothetical protein
VCIGAFTNEYDSDNLNLRQYSQPTHLQVDPAGPPAHNPKQYGKDAKVLIAAPSLEANKSPAGKEPQQCDEATNGEFGNGLNNEG